MIKQIALATAFLACMSGGAKAQAVDPFIGQIETFSFAFCPHGWLPTKGQLVSITNYSVLFQLIGTTYGGDGVTTFALPKTRVLTTTNNVHLTQCISTLGVFPSQG
jgi:microcystin-dependent protein